MSRPFRANLDDRLLSQGCRPGLILPAPSGHSSSYLTKLIVPEKFPEKTGPDAFPILVCVPTV